MGPLTIKRISLYIRRRIITLRRLGQKYNGIARTIEYEENLHITPKAIARIWKKFQTTGQLKDKQRSGRPTKLGDRERQFID